MAAVIAAHVIAVILLLGELIFNYLIPLTLQLIRKRWKLIFILFLSKSCVFEDMLCVKLVINYK